MTFVLSSIRKNKLLIVISILNFKFVMIMICVEMKLFCKTQVCRRQNNMSTVSMCKLNIFGDVPSYMSILRNFVNYLQ